MQLLLSSKPFNFKNNAFDLIRLIMSILIVVGHSGGIGGFGWEPNLKMHDWQIIGTNLATFSVYIFFIISGFLVTYSWTNSSSLQDFCIKRIKRIYPGFLASLIICSGFFVPTFYFLTRGFHPIQFIKEFGAQSSQFMITNIFIEVRQAGVNGLTSDLKGGFFGVNAPYWSLIHEVRAYLMVAVLGQFRFLNKTNILLFIAVIFNIIYFICASDFVLNIGLRSLHFRDLISTFLAHYHFFIIFTYFIFGMVFYVFHKKIIWNNWFYALTILGLVSGWKLDIFPIFAPICLTYFVLYSSQILPLKNIKSKIGDISYGIYIYSWPIQLCLMYFGLNKITGNKYYDYSFFAAISILISMLAGYLSWNFVEKRWIVARKHIDSNKLD